MQPQKPWRPTRSGGQRAPLRRRQTTPESPSRAWLVVACVVTTIAGGWLIATNIRSSSEHDARAAEERVRTGLPEAASLATPFEEAPLVEPEDDWEEDVDIVQSSNDSPSDTYKHTASTVAGDESGQPRQHSRAAKYPQAKPAPPLPKPAPEQENRFFTLQLSGSLGGEPLDPNDAQTWARLSYFLREEAPTRSYLVYPNGSMPLSMPRNPGAATKPKKRDAGDASPVGDRSAPTYRLVIASSAQSAGKVTFYGNDLASRYQCKISCRVERRTPKADGTPGGEEFEVVDQTAVEEAVTPTKGANIDPATQVRQLHDAAIEKLVKQLQTRAVFRAK